MTAIETELDHASAALEVADVRPHGGEYLEALQEIAQCRRQQHHAFDFPVRWAVVFLSRSH